MPEIGSVISYWLAEASKRKAAWVVAMLIVLFFVFFNTYDPPCQHCPPRILKS